MLLVGNYSGYILLKLDGCIMKTKFNKDSLVVEQNNYATKIVNIYIAYDLDDWTNNPLRNFSIKKLII